jgi:GxxExxY protein
MASKQTVTFTLTDAQAKKWTGILQSKEGVKKLTASLRELEKLKKYKEAQQIKKTNKKRLDIPTDQGFPVTASYKLKHWKQYSSQISAICDICRTVYLEFPFSGKEHHFQSALEEELRDAGYQVQQEVARLLHYKKQNGETIQLPHDIRGREDLLLPREKLILELKQVTKLTDKEFCQVCRYMQERCVNSVWGTDTRGMLINFGDTQLECWYLFYDKSNRRITRVQVAVINNMALNTYLDTYYKHC